MCSGIKKSGSAHGLMVVLMLLAMAIRAALPQGYMPTATADGIAITLCTADGVQTSVLLSQHDKTPSDSSDESGNTNCAFALAQSSAVSPFAMGPVQPLLFTKTPQIAGAIADLTIHRLAAPPPPSHAPPAQS